MQGAPFLPRSAPLGSVPGPVLLGHGWSVGRYLPEGLAGTQGGVEFGRQPLMGVVPTQARLIELSLTQGDLAALLCASRQRINGVLRQLQALGVLGGSHGRIEVLLPQKLADVATGKLVLDTAGG